LVLVLISASPAAAFGQRKGPIKDFTRSAAEPDKETPEAQLAARRRAAGIQEVQGFGVQKEPKRKPFPWLAVSMALLFAMALSPIAYRLFKSTRKDLEEHSTFGLKGSRREAREKEGPPSISRRPPARSGKPAQGETRIVADMGRTPRDAVWDAMGSAKSWVTAEWVASTASLGPSEAVDELAALAQEGFLQESQDRSGKQVFRIPS